jgi:hypothetical protein
VISATELTAMQADLTASMPSTVNISRVTLTSDGMGGQSEAWATVGTVVARVSPNGAGLDDIAGGEVINQTPWVVTVPVGTSGQRARPDHLQRPDLRGGSHRHPALVGYLRSLRVHGGDLMAYGKGKGKGGRRGGRGK